MNDLAEQALHWLDIARRRVVDHPVLVLAVAGFAASAAIVVVGARIGPAPDAIPLGRWLGLIPNRSIAPRDAVPGTLMIAAIGALILLWLLTMLIVRKRDVAEAHVWALGGIWALPFVLGPPLLSTDVYGFAANGLLARAGQDPYSHGPASLGPIPIVNAIDPTWRSAPSTGGPLSILIEHLAVAISGGSALGAVLVLRALAVGSVIAIGVLAARLGGPRRAGALAITVLNPALLLYVVSGAHLEGVLGALLLGSLVAASQRRWVLSVVLAAAAAGIKPVALVAVVAIIAMHAIGSPARWTWRIAARDVVLAAGTLALFVLIVPNGLGWIGNFGTALREHTAYAPASIVSDVIAPIVSSASFDDLAVGGRLATAVAAATVVAYLLVTVRSRPIERTVGFALLAIALLGPVLYPWNLLWGVLCLAPTAAGERRDWVIALSCVACVLTPVGFAHRTGQVVTIIGLAVIGLAVLPRLAVNRHARLVLARREAGVPG
jgi:hypothetical protein